MLGVVKADGVTVMHTMEKRLEVRDIVFPIWQRTAEVWVSDKDDVKNNMEQEIFQNGILIHFYVWRNWNENKCDLANKLTNS